MFIKKLILKNIRSYIEEEIKFPEGVVLLSGDIGCGKSTILLAVDFALFGIRRGEISGSTLLRNGAEDGYVNLLFSINNKDIYIKRTLKKTSNGIVQNSGYLTINDVTQELTPVELKQKILEILNYPQELITKKSLIYKYTVYTPQEEMKLILLGTKEDRLETLRKVFNIDKYKRIKENSKIITSQVKEKKKEHQILSSDLDDKIKLQNQKELNLQEKTNLINSNKISLEILNNKIKESKEKNLILEKEIEKLKNLKKDLEVNKSTLNSKQELKNLINNQINQIEKQIQELQSKITTIENNNFKELILESEKQIEVLEKELKEYTTSKIHLNSKKQFSNEIKNKINSLSSCPLCLQEVSNEHKHSIITKEDETIKLAEEKILSLVNSENEISNKIKLIKLNLQELRTKERDSSLNQVRIEEIKQKQNQIINLKNNIQENELQINILQEKKIIIENELKLLENIENEYKIIKQDLEKTLESQKQIELNVAISNKELENLKTEINSLKLEIIKKENSKKKFEYYTSLQNWIEDFFTNMIDNIERKVMLKLHTDFNLLFQNWFSMLINSDLLKVRLDEEFTPLIEQNGHDIEYENLSGGEKTACALAYRLALNQVINILISSINTKDLIILDEPTDGFSTEQLDRLRPVLEELKMKQIIIVSHESKIESFANNIIKIEKQGHISKILN